MIRAAGMRSIVTEVFFENTEYVDNDAVFGVRRSLIAKVEPYTAEKVGALALVRTPDAMIHFDFVLAPGE
jgi:hydroxyquinol 1,2-dioxygenase